MTLKEFLTENNVSAFETVNDQLIMNAIVGEVSYGLDVDTSQLTSGTHIVKFTDFTIDEDLLTVNNINININKINMLPINNNEEINFLLKK
jgi:hypothetical protein